MGLTCPALCPSVRLSLSRDALALNADDCGDDWFVLALAGGGAGKGAAAGGVALLGEEEKSISPPRSSEVPPIEESGRGGTFRKSMSKFDEALLVLE